MARIMKDDRMGRLPAQPNLSLVNGMECLEALVTANQGVSSRELARTLGLEHTRVNRLLGTLAYLGLAERTPDRKYTPGAGVHVLAAISLRTSRLLTCALPHLHELMATEPQCCIALGVLWRTHVCYLFFAMPGKPIEEAVANQDPYKAELSSIGQVLLAQESPADVRALFHARTSSPPTPEKLRSLLADLKTVRQQGYALVRENTLGVAIGNPAIAGLAAAGDISARRRPSLVKTLQRTADRLQPR